MKAVINGKLVFPEEIREGTLTIAEDRITGILPAGSALPAEAEIIDAEGLFVGPGLVDEHVHGYSRYGENFDILHDLNGAAQAHLKHGTTAMTPSPSYSLRLDGYLNIIAQAVGLIERGNSPVAGIHLEGPYINPHMGAGRKYAWKYSDEIFEKLFTAAGGHVLHCTYAPEMPWAPAVEQMIRRFGAVMDIGHTEAGPEDIARSAEAGLSIVTHLFDGMGNSRGMHAFDFTGDPQDCVSDIVLGIPGLYYELICDSRYAHTTASSQKLAYRVAGEDHIILVSDCTCYNRRDLDPSEFPEEDLRSARDLNINQSGALFGSRLTVRECAMNFKKTTGIGIRETFKCASTNAAKALHLYGRIGSVHPGKRADLVFTDEEFVLKKVIFGGNVLPEIRN